MEVRRVVDDDWQAVRAVRLQALQDTPLAFASTYEREVAFADEVWRTRIAQSAQFLAEEDGRVVGIATGYVDPTVPDAVRLVAMFVIPEARGRGVAADLVDAVVEDARRRSFSRVVLDVVETNLAARSTYERYGFVETGATTPLPHRPELNEIELAYAIDRPPASQTGPVGPTTYRGVHGDVGGCGAP